MGAKERITEYLNSKGLTVAKMEHDLGWGNGGFAKTKSISTEKTIEFLLMYSEVSPDWLLLGKGDMIRRNETIQISSDKTKGAIPYYKDLPVSAGKVDVVKKFMESEEEQGWIQLPKASAIAAFPVSGCSMEPLIRAGDFVAIAPIERWDKIDPDKIYMIITKYERMIKHIMVDDNSDSYIWAVSPNYNKFKVPVEDIIEIYKVVFHGRLM